jgi:hypothetical protein
MAALNGMASGEEVSSSKKISEKYPAPLLVFLGWTATFIPHLESLRAQLIAAMSDAQ